MYYFLGEQKSYDFLNVLRIVWFTYS